MLLGRRNSFYLNLLAVFVGIIAGYGAIGFRTLIGFFQNLFFYNRIDYHMVTLLDNARGGWIVIFPALGITLAALIVWRFAREAKGHGVPEVIEAVLTRGGHIRKRVVFIKAIASSLTIASGGSVGREGPIVQIGSAAGSTLGRFFRVPGRHLKVLVGCGAAGAISATFNTPIAGVIFAIELIVLEFRAKSFIPLVISSVFACVVSRYHLGNDPAFIVPHHTLAHPLELLFYLGLGILAGPIGVMTIKILYGMEDLVDRIKINFVFKAMLGGLLLGGVGYYYPQIFGVGYEAVSEVLNQNYTLGLMAMLILLKILMMSLTLASGGSGGVFAPSLFIGAMVGGAYGFIINKYFPGISAPYGAYALVGMAALFAATGRATFTAIVILFEMTGDYSIILPLMFSCVVADQVAHFISKNQTIYSVKLQRKGLQMIEGFGANAFELTRIKDIMCTELVVLNVGMSVSEAFEKIKDYHFVKYPVVNSEGIIMGMVRGGDIGHEMSKIARGAPDKEIEAFMIGTPVAVPPNESVMNCLKRLWHSNDRRLVVVCPDTKKLLGIVTPSNLVSLSCQESDECSEDIV